MKIGWEEIDYTTFDKPSCAYFFVRYAVKKIAEHPLCKMFTLSRMNMEQDIGSIVEACKTAQSSSAQAVVDVLNRYLDGLFDRDSTLNAHYIEDVSNAAKDHYVYPVVRFCERIRKATSATPECIRSIASDCFETFESKQPPAWRISSRAQRIKFAEHQLQEYEEQTACREWTS